MIKKKTGSEVRSTNKNIMEVVELARQLLFCADKGDLQREDAGCGVLYGIVRDCAYRIQKQALKEIDAHKAGGIWDVKNE
ncbi:MAG: hypothetical protein ACLFVQ_14420 [Chitinispirillaceae bacterium]